MREEKIVMFRNRLAKVYRHLSRQARRTGVSCYRVYDHDLPEFPFCIEIYEGKLYLAEYRRKHNMDPEQYAQWLKDSLRVTTEVLGFSEENTFFKLRQRKQGRLGQYQRSGEKVNEFTVNENGLKFIVNLDNYLDTGLFLDHRMTRQKIRTESENKRLLNLFCYTGSFSVYAAAGGAKEVVSVDLSRTYLDRAIRNMQLNGFGDQEKYHYVQADVKQYLVSLPANYFDLVIMDPPTFSNSKRMKDFLDIQRDHVSLINKVLRALTPGGVLLFSTNFSKFQLDTERIQAASVRDITKATTPFDFEGKLLRYCYRIIK